MDSFPRKDARQGVVSSPEMRASAIEMEGDDLQPDSWTEFLRRDSACERAWKQPSVTRTLLTLGEADERRHFDETTLCSSSIDCFWMKATMGRLGSWIIRKAARTRG